MRFPFLAQVFVYSGVIAGVMVYSGGMAEKTIYDLSVVRGEGTVVRTSDVERAKTFYSRVLDLKPIISNERIAGIALPGGQKIFFEMAKPPVVPAQIVVKVRSRIAKIQEAILQRSSTSPASNHVAKLTPLTGPSYETLPPERVSEISEQSWGDEFAVSDPDGNKLIFVQPKRRSGSRL